MYFEVCSLKIINKSKHKKNLSQIVTTLTLLMFNKFNLLE